MVVIPCYHLVWYNKNEVFKTVITWYGIIGSTNPHELQGFVGISSKKNL